MRLRRWVRCCEGANRPDMRNPRLSQAAAHPGLFGNDRAVSLGGLYANAVYHSDDCPLSPRARAAPDIVLGLHGDRLAILEAPFVKVRAPDPRT